MGSVKATVVAVTLAASVLQPGPSAKEVTASARQYLSGYQKALSYLLADEVYTQRVLDRSGRERESRTLKGESFVTYAAGQWMSVRDVAEVDGRPIADRDGLRELLTRDSLSDVRRRLIAHNSGFNIGGITRNFNEPTLALLVLDPVRRMQFSLDRKGLSREGDSWLAVLEYKESDRPTLVRGTDGRDVPSKGELIVETATGRVRKTHMHFTYSSITADLTTTYAREPKLDVWVPVLFEERYERSAGPREVITCEASYSNYRRFEVNIRIR